MKNFFVLSFLFISTLLSSQCYPPILTKVSYEKSTKYVGLDENLNKTQYYEFVLEENDITYELNSNYFGDSTIVMEFYTISNCELNSQLKNISIKEGSQSSSINDLPRNEKIVLKINYFNSLKGKIEFNIKEIHTSFTTESYNKTNSYFNPVALNIGNENISLEDNLNGIRKAGNKYTKWYSLNNSSEISYYTVNLTSTKELELKLYYFKNDKLKELHLPYKENNYKIPFVILKDKKYILSISSVDTPNAEYSIDMELISNNLCGNIDNLISDFNFSNFNKNKAEISPGDTLVVELMVSDYLPFANNWIHSFVSNPPLEAEVIFDQDMLSSFQKSSGGKFVPISSTLDFEGYEGKFQGPGNYFIQNKIGPISSSPFYSWGIKPSLNNEHFTSTTLFKIDENIDCTLIDTLTFNFEIITDALSGGYKNESCNLTQQIVKIPISCCSGTSKEENISLCHGDDMEIIFDSQEQYYFVQNPMVEVIENQKNIFTVSFKNDSKEYLSHTLEFYTLGECIDKKIFNLEKLADKNIEIEPHFSDPLTYQFDGINLQEINQTEWKLDGSIIGNDLSVTLDQAPTTDVNLNVLVSDFNNCEFNDTHEINPTNYSSLYDFNIEPNPALKDFSISIFSISQEADNSSMFNIRIYTQSGNLVYFENDKSIGSHFISTFLSSGSYYCQLTIGSTLVKTKTLVITN